MRYPIFVLQDLIKSVSENFRTFGGGNVTMGNPISHVLQDEPLQFAAGVDVKQVIVAILNNINFYDVKEFNK